MTPWLPSWSPSTPRASAHSPCGGSTECCSCEPSRGRDGRARARRVAGLPVYNERTVVQRLIERVGELRYPADRLEIQVLDDSTDETTGLAAEAVERLVAAGVDAHHVRRPDRAGFKAGALDHGLDSARGELIAIFDADFMPEPDFLERLVGEFEDPGVGMVQARWGHLDRDAGW
ncbi:MAG: glycosyltransferase, partial [Planctomycetota bacterium]